MTRASGHNPGIADPAPPMVGRMAERVLLSEQLAAVEAGRGSVVIVGGEAGIGKTTIARDLAIQAQARGFNTFTGHSYDLIAAPPYGLWLDFGERYQRRGGGSGLPSLPDMLGSRSLDGITSQSALFAEVSAFIQAVAAASPVVIVLEDVQWADPASLELLRHVAAHIREMPAVLVITYREDELTRQHPFYQKLPALVRESEGLRLDLARMTVTELDQLVATHCTLDPHDRARLVAYLDEHGEGNPFFALELIRELDEQGVLAATAEGDRWALGDLDRIVVPPLVRQVIDNRLLRLGEATRNALTVAAVIGHTVSPDVVSDITGRPQDEVFDAIDRAIDWHLLTPTPSGDGVQFTHALTREALYAGLPPHRRRELHRQVAETLERDPQPDADAVAFHYQQAGDPRAPDWLIRAGDRAQRAYAWLTAHDRFETAAELLADVPGEERTQARLHYRCGRLLRYSHPDAAIRHLDAASRLAERVGDRLISADARMAKGLVQCFAGNWAEGLPNQVEGVEGLLALPASESYIPSGDSSWMADALPYVALQPETHSAPSLIALDANRHMSLAWFLAAGGRLSETDPVVEQYRHLVPDRAIGPLPIANIGHNAVGRGTLRASLGHPGRAQAAFADALSAYRMIDHHACIAFASIIELLDVLLPYMATDLDERRRKVAQAVDAVDQARGAFHADLSPDIARLPTLFIDGQWREAREIVSRGTSPAAYPLRRAMNRVVAPIAHAMGETDTAMSIITEFLPAGPTSEPGTAVLLDALAMQRLAATVALDASDTEGARRWLEANDRWLEWSGSVLGRADNLLVWARFHQHSGDLAHAEALAQQAVAAATDPDQPLALIGAQRLVGVLALASGDSQTAEAGLSDALALADACAAPYERALTLIELARLPGADMSALLDEARDTCERLGAIPALERIDSLSRQPRSRRNLDPAGLTAREVEVLRLVARGMTDAEVAERLYISPRTVGQHLRSVYQKLDVRSRTEATRVAVDRGIA